MRRFFGRIFCPVFLLLCGFAQAAFPERPIDLIIPFPAGGGGDLSARIIAAALGDRLGEPLTVTNATGAGGIVGMTRAARARADGYTLVYAAIDAFAVNPFIFRKLTYQISDFTLIGLASRTGVMLLIDPELPIHNFGEFIAYAKANPGKLVWGSAGVGLTSHQALQYLIQREGVEILHVPFSGGAAAVNDFLGKRVSVIANTPSSSAQFVKTGQMRPLGITSPVRSPLLPDVPTFAELGRPDFDFDVRYAIMAPATTPKDIVERLQKELHAVLTSPAVAEQLKKIDYVPFNATVEEGTQMIRSEVKKKRPIIEQMGLKLD